MTELEVVAVADLPYAHNPFRCAHAERFEAPPDHASDEERAEAGRRFYATLGRRDFRRCEYHQADWEAIAAAAVAVVTTPAAGMSYEERVAREARRHRLSSKDGVWLLFLLGDPIVWTPGQPLVANGQHRVCALRAAGATACPVATA